MPADILFEPIRFHKLEVKNRIWRSNISGRFDNYDGSGNQARINWEVKFARGGVGAILSSYVPVHMRGRIMPGYATIDRDETIPFWREVGRRVHEFDCKYILQLSHGGRQRDIQGIEWEKGLSSTDKEDPIHGFQAERMSKDQIDEVVACFAEGARRAREAGLDGVELHSANGYLITQFLSSAINDRKDEYGGSLQNRARFLLEIVRAIRAKVGRDFHLQAKISATELCNAMTNEPRGNTIEDSVQVCKWLEQEGVDAIHVSTGGFFAHPRNPAGDLPVEDFVRTYDTMVSSGAKTWRNYVLLRNKFTGELFRRQWLKERGDVIEGLNLPDSHAIKQAVTTIPILCTGGFQTASVMREAINSGKCDAVTIARSLVANPDLPDIIRRGMDQPDKPCTYCNKCLVNVLEHPLGCYDQTRFPSHEAMIREIMSVFQPPPEFRGQST